MTDPDDVYRPVCRDCWECVDGVHICEVGDLARVAAYYRMLANLDRLVDGASRP